VEGDETDMQSPFFMFVVEKMKCVKFLVIFSIIALSLCTERKVKTTTEAKAKVSTKTKDSWTNPLNVWLTVGSTCKEMAGTLNYNNIISPSTTNMKKGLCISVSSPSTACQAYLYKSDNLWCLPLRFISNPFSWTNPSFAGKYISGTYNSGSGSAVSVTLLFQYATIGWYINNDQLTQLTNSLNTGRNSVINSLANNKNTATTAINSYFSNQANLDAAKLGTNGINAQISTFNATINSCTESNAKNTVTLTNILSQITALENQVADLQTSTTNYNKAIEACQGIIKSSNDSISSLTPQLTSKTIDSTSYTSAVATAQTALTNAIAAMKTDCYDCTSATLIQPQVTAGNQSQALTAIASVR